MRQEQQQGSQGEDIVSAFAEQLQQALAQALAPLREDLARQLLEPMQAMLAQTLAPLTTQQRELLAQTFATVTEQLGRQLAELAREVAGPIEQKVIELDAPEIKPVFTQAGFWITPSMPIAILLEIKGLGEQGTLSPCTVKQLILERYREHNCALLRNMVDEWHENPLFTPRMRIFQDALEAHIAGKYTLSVPSLLPQAEGIAARVAGRLPGKDSKALFETVGEKMPDFLSHLMKEALLSYITDTAYSYVNFGEFAEWLERRGVSEKEILHRHAILHGVQTGYDSEENSLRAFLLLDALSSLKPVLPERS